MKPLKFIPSFLFLLTTYTLSGQTVQFTYDANGNRLTRSIIIEELQSNSVSFPVINPESLGTKFIDNKTKGSNKVNSEDVKSSDSMEAEIDDSEIKAKIFPNPNKGLLKVEISNMPRETTNELRLYDLNGTELMVQKNFDWYHEVDINHLKNGYYILRIRIKESLFDFKVILNR